MANIGPLPPASGGTAGHAGPMPQSGLTPFAAGGGRAISFDGSDAIALGDTDLSGVWLGDHLIWNLAVGGGDFPVPQAVPGTVDPALGAPSAVSATSGSLQLQDYVGAPRLMIGTPPASPSGPILGYVVQVRPRTSSGLLLSMGGTCTNLDPFNHGRTWADLVAEADGWKTAQWLAYGDPADASMQVFAPGPTDSKKIAVLGLTPGPQYEARVAAYTAAGIGAWSTTFYLQAVFETASATDDVWCSVPRQLVPYTRTSSDSYPGRIGVTITHDTTTFRAGEATDMEFQVRRAEWFGYDDKWEDAAHEWLDPNGLHSDPMSDTVVLPSVPSKAWYQVRARYVTANGPSHSWADLATTYSTGLFKQGWVYPTTGIESLGVIDPGAHWVFNASFTKVNKGMIWEDAPADYKILENYYGATGIKANGMSVGWSDGSQPVDPVSPNAFKASDRMVVVTTTGSSATCRIRTRRNADSAWVDSPAALPFTGPCAMCWDDTTSKFYIASASQLYSAPLDLSAFTLLGTIGSIKPSFMTSFGSTVWVDGGHMGYATTDAGKTWVACTISGQLANSEWHPFHPPVRGSDGVYRMLMFSKHATTAIKYMQMAESPDCVMWSKSGWNQISWSAGAWQAGFLGNDSVLSAGPNNIVGGSVRPFFPTCENYLAANNFGGQSTTMGAAVWNGTRWISHGGFLGRDTLKPMAWESIYSLPAEESPPGWWDHLPSLRPPNSMAAEQLVLRP